MLRNPLSRRQGALFLSTALVLSLASACSQAPDSDKAEVGDAQEVPEAQADAATMAVNTDASVIEWVGTKVTGRHNGTFQLADGSLEMDQDGNLVGGSFTIDMNSLKVTDEAGDKLRGHLASPDFFNLEEHPEATFVLTGAAPFEGETENEEVEEISEYKVSDPTHTISGNLTMVGVTKGISFPAKVMVMENGLEAKAKFNINRKEWDINYAGKPDDLIRDDVHLGIHLVAGEAEPMAHAGEGDHAAGDDHSGHDH